MITDKLYAEELAFKIQKNIVQDIDVKIKQFQKELQNNS